MENTMHKWEARRSEKYQYFDCIARTIKREKTEFDKTSLDYMTRAKDILEIASAGIEGALNGGKFFLGGEADEIARAMGRKAISSREETEKIKEKLISSQEWIEQLKENPYAFYKTRNAEELKNICEAIRSEYL